MQRWQKRKPADRLIGPRDAVKLLWQASWLSVVTRIWRDTGHCLGGSEEGLGGSQVAVLTQHDVDQGAVAIDCAMQIPPLATPL
jgi:hypothetical protein